MDIGNVKEYSPSLMRFLRPKVPSLSQIDSSFSVLATTGRGDFGLAVAISFMRLQFNSRSFLSPSTLTELSLSTTAVRLVTEIHSEVPTGAIGVSVSRK